MSPTTADRSDRASTAVISARSFAFTFEDDDGVSSTRTSFVVLDGLIGGSTLTELNTISHASTEANGNSISLSSESYFRTEDTPNRVIKAQEKEEEKTKVSFFFERDVVLEIVPLKDGFSSQSASSFPVCRKKKNVVAIVVSHREERETTSSVLPRVVVVRHVSSFSLGPPEMMMRDQKQIFDFSIPKREEEGNEKHNQITHVEYQ